MQNRSCLDLYMGIPLVREAILMFFCTLFLIKSLNPFIFL